MKYIKLFENFNEKSIADICKRYRIDDYTINQDGSIDVDGNVDLSKVGQHYNQHQLKKLPLKFRKVLGDFNCSSNELTSLEGCPEYIGENFFCYKNEITNFKHCPKYVGGMFSASTNKLTSLEGCPEIINGNFNVMYNKLTSLEFSPRKVLGDFKCHDNLITDLNHSPEYVSGDYECDENKIKTLIGLKTEINGDFYSEKDIQIIYEILIDHLEYINNFYDFNIITDFDSDPKTLNMKRLIRFIELYDLTELNENFIEKIKKNYNVI